MGLKLLEATQIVRRIAALKTHLNPELSGLANSIAAQWRVNAADALKYANQHLQARGRRPA